MKNEWYFVFEKSGFIEGCKLLLEAVTLIWQLTSLKLLGIYVNLRTVNVVINVPERE